MKSFILLTGMVAAGLLAFGCSTVPPTVAERSDLNTDSIATLQSMYAADPGLHHFLDSAFGYVVFPDVGSGAAGIGGSYGHGEVFQQGKFIGYADISQWTVGAQLGGQGFAEVIAFERPWALRQFEAGQTTFDANASAVAVKAGADATAAYNNGVAVFTQASGGLMLQAAIGGQSFSFASANLNIAPPVASTDNNGNSNEQQQ